MFTSDPAGLIEFFPFFFFLQSTQKVYCEPQRHPRSGTKQGDSKLSKYARLLIKGVDL